MTRKKNSILLTTSALLIVMPTISMADNNSTTDVYSEVSTQPIDFIARAEAFKSLDVVDRQGNEIGNISDFIIDFGGSELLYTLLAIEQGGNGAFAESDAESDADDESDESDESDDSEDDSGENEGGQSAAFYPLPLDALRLVALEDLTAATSDDDEEETDGESESSAEEDDQTSDEGIDEALANMTVNDVVGTPVVTEDDETISDISDVVVLSQEPHFVMGVGGFLGIGETNVAIRARQFSLDAENERFVLPLTADQLRDMPDAEYNEEASPLNSWRSCDVALRGCFGDFSRSESHSFFAAGVTGRLQEMMFAG